MVASAEDAQAMRAVSSNSGKFRFSSAAIPKGAILNFVKDTAITAVVEDDATVLFDGSLYSLTASALEAL